MNLFRTIIGILHNDAVNRKLHQTSHYYKHWIAAAHVQDAKLAGLMFAVNRAQTEMDEYVLSRMEKR